MSLSGWTQDSVLEGKRAEDPGAQDLGELGLEQKTSDTRMGRATGRARARPQDRGHHLEAEAGQDLRVSELTMGATIPQEPGARTGGRRKTENSHQDYVLCKMYLLMKMV